MKYLLLFTLLIYPLSGYLSTELIQLKYQKLSIDVPTSWKIEKGLMGMAITLFGPNGNEETRPVMTMNSAEQKVRDLFFAQTEKEIGKSYQEGKNKWLAKRKGSLNEYFSLVAKKSPQGLHFVELGTSYTLGTQQIIERSIYYQCPHSMVQLKGLTYLSQEKEFMGAWEKVKRSFQCIE